MNLIAVVPPADAGFVFSNRPFALLTAIRCVNRLRPAIDGFVFSKPLRV